MSSSRDVARVVRSWLREDAHEDASRVLDSVLDQLDTTPQRRLIWPVRRFLAMNGFTRLATVTAAVVAIAVIGLALASRSNVAKPAPSAAANTPRPSCPVANGGGGACLGTLAGGTYTAVGPEPVVTYTVPSGWSNLDDSRGGLLLLPPGAQLAGVDAGTSDYIALHTGVALADAKCTDNPAAGVGRSSAEIAQALVARPGLQTTTPRPVTIGSLSGYVLDIRLADGWKEEPCKGVTAPGVTLLVGQGVSHFANGVVGKIAIRLYLLDAPGKVWAIEADDVTGGSHLDAYGQIIERFWIGK